MPNRTHLFVRGLVQGVGFRPFVRNLAVSYGLKGYVLNLGDAGVEILLEGDDSRISSFIKDMLKKKPSVANVESVERKDEPHVGNFKDFTIEKSNDARLTVKSVIPVDLSICDACITDIYKAGRWKRYPFTSCAQCGPRFTMLDKLPYDRQNTSMTAFPLCPDCEREYLAPTDRRYDAQGIACSCCGPVISLVDKKGVSVSGDPFITAAKLLSEGNIIAIKGIGGFHIAVDPFNELSLRELRRRRRRPTQPFAVMSRSLENVTKFAKLNSVERTLLSNVFKPIVILPLNASYRFAESVAPGLDSIGVMLPYTGIHLLLMDAFKKDALVMTSGNYPGKPINISNEKAVKDLNEIVDYYLLHNRNISNRCDDSVIKVIDATPLFLRRSRGYAPSYLKIPWDIGDDAIISSGGEFNVTGSIMVKDRVITTQHIGDMNELETLDYLRNSIKYILDTYNISKITRIAHDLNPAFQTTRMAKDLANSYGARTIPVQHHHAHFAALLAENQMPLDARVVGITIDGVGYGYDGGAWGGELFHGTYGKIERVAHLKSQPMPGGDLCAYYPARMLASILSNTMSDEDILKLYRYKYARYLRHGLNELEIILKQAKDPNTIKASSLGRILDSIAVALDVCHIRTYEGEPPMRLESIANLGTPDVLRLELKADFVNNQYVFDTSAFLFDILEKIKTNRVPDIAYACHKAIATALANVACELSDQYSTPYVGLTGGCAVNALLFNHIKKTVEHNNKRLLIHTTYPCGDGCISLGQSIVASATQIL